MNPPDRGLLYAIILFTSGIIISAYGPGPVWRLAICGVFLLFLLFLAISRKQSRLWDILLLSLFFTIGWTRGYTSNQVQFSDEKVWISGEVLYPVEKSDEFTRVRLKLKNWEKLDKNGRLKGKAIIYLSEDANIQVGSEIRLAGRLEAVNKAMNPGDFNRKAYWALRGINWKIIPSGKNDFEVIKEKTLLGIFSSKLAAFADYSRKSINQYFSPETSEMAISLLTGERINWDQGLRDQLSHSGLMHLFAISGLHVGIIVGFFLLILPFFRTGVKSTYIIILFVVWFYVLFTGSNPPVIRAALMFTIWIGARFLGRVQYPFRGLLLSWLILLVLHPEGLYDAGFQLSFAGAGGAIFAAHRFRYLVLPFQSGPLKGVKVSRFFILNQLIYTILVSTGAWLATLPAIIWHFGKLPWLASIYTLPALLLISMAIACIWVTVLLGKLVVVAHIFASAGSFFLEILKYFTALPSGSKIVSEFLPISSVIWALLAIIFVVIFTRDTQNSPFKSSLLTAASVIIVVLLSNINLVSRSVKMGILYVGQGDGIIIRQGQRAVIIDGGPSTSDALIKQIRLCGIKKVDLWIITHGDSDHASAVAEACNKIPVKYALIGPGTKDDNAGKMAIESLENNGTEILIGKNGSKAKLGSLGEFEIISPDIRKIMVQSNDNDLSLVIMWKIFDQTFLFPGDIGSSVEKYIIAENMIEDVDFMLCAHHGSKHSNCDIWLSELSPELAAISCGINNRYNHPAPEVLERLNKYSIPFRRTDIEGALTYSISRYGLKPINWMKWW